MRRSGQAKNRGKLMFVGRPFKSRQSDGPVCIKTRGHNYVCQMVNVQCWQGCVNGPLLQKMLLWRSVCQYFGMHRRLLGFCLESAQLTHAIISLYSDVHKRARTCSPRCYGLVGIFPTIAWRIYWLLRRAWQHGVGSTVDKWLDSWSRWRGFKSAWGRNFYSRFTITSANMAKSRSMNA